MQRVQAGEVGVHEDQAKVGASANGAKGDQLRVLLLEKRIDEHLRLRHRDGLVATACDLEYEMQHPPALGGNGGCIRDTWHGGRVAGEATFWARAQNVASCV